MDNLDSRRHAGKVGWLWMYITIGCTALGFILIGLGNVEMFTVHKRYQHSYSLTFISGLCVCKKKIRNENPQENPVMESQPVHATTTVEVTKAVEEAVTEVVNEAVIAYF